RLHPPSTLFPYTTLFRSSAESPSKQLKLLSKIFEKQMPREGLVYEFGEFRVNRISRQLLHGDQPLTLTNKCFELLVLLVQNQGEDRTTTRLNSSHVTISY